MKTIGIVAVIIVLLVAGIAAVKTMLPQKTKEITLPEPEKPVQHVPLANATVFFDTIPFSDDDIIAPARGANTFYGNIQSVKIPDPDKEEWALDNDVRFLWSRLQPTSANDYKWETFDDHIRQSIDKRQRVSFGIVTVCTTCPEFDGIVHADGATASYPLFVHNAMQAEPVTDWRYDGKWIPNWNSEAYLSAFESFLRALADHIKTGSYKGVSFKDVIYKIDIRGFGNWGEWHTYPWIRNGDAPVDTRPTDNTLIRIIDAHRKAFPTYPLMANINMFNGEIGPPVGYYGLTTSNEYGRFGIRSDHLGDKNTFDFDITNNKRTFKGLSFQKEIINRWKSSPVCGEPMNNKETVTRGGDWPFYHLADEVRTMHISQFSNTSCATANPDANDMFRKASKISGYRLQLYDGIISKKIHRGDSLQVKLDWANTGIAPVYENWNTIFELRSSQNAKPVWTGTSSFNARLFLPGSKTVEDIFNIPSLIKAGPYSLYLLLKDPAGYRKPLPLAIKGRNDDGSYLLGNVEIIK